MYCVKSISNSRGNCRNRGVDLMAPSRRSSKASGASENLGRPTQEQADTYDRLFPMLEAAHHEMSELSKKKQDGVLNPLKVRNINRLLGELQKLLENDPSKDYVELLDDETLPQNSDAVLLLSQWRAALRQYRVRHAGGVMGKWRTVESPEEEYL